eukprot:1280437-Pleurochrysis_carterae.AAC.1
MFRKIESAEIGKEQWAMNPMRVCKSVNNVGAVTFAPSCTQALLAGERTRRGAPLEAASPLPAGFPSPA